jgi:LPXTG-site transpeptidase (sortase) family protein
MNMSSKNKDLIISALISMGVFIVILTVLIFLGLTPKTFSVDNEPEKPLIKNQEEVIDSNNDSYTRPDAIVIPKINVNAVIEKPNSTDVATLDNALTNGAVHYPGSGSIEEGNMFIFGHSSNWKIVQNQAYKTFNGLEKLNSGDEIIIESDGQSYVYLVNSVKLVDEDDALVEFNNSKRSLTISTCNTFGEKQERWVVEADFNRKI